MPWLSIDGTEGVGKSSLVTCLAQRLPAVLPLPEFSSGIAGTVLSTAVRQDPHYISPSPVAQSLLFLAEFREKVDADIAPVRNTTIVMTDRGLLSKYVYQQVVLAHAVGDDRAAAILDAALGDITPPELTICLTADQKAIADRLTMRGEKRDAKEWEFIGKISNLFLEDRRFSGIVIIDTTRLSTHEVCERAAVIIRATLLSAH